MAGLPDRVALVHDWLTTYVGGERVLEQMIRLFPQGNVYASVDILPPDERAFLQGKEPITTFVQRFPWIARRYRSFLPLLMFAMEQLDVSDSELVLSSSSAIGKGILTGPDQLHISYVHSPMRYAWDMQHQYLHEAGLTHGLKSWIARWLLHKARLWDLRTANGVDHFIANSQFIARRIWKTYRRESTVIYPPVDVSSFLPAGSKDRFYLTASRFVPYKKVPAIVEAFRLLPGRKLVVVGTGADESRVKAAAGSNVEILGYQPTPALRELMQKARAFVFAAEEDFGITPVEAQACGTPVIAYGRGGALETILGAEHAHPTGTFFDAQTPQAIAAAVQDFEGREDLIRPEACRENALRFSVENFRRRYSQFVTQCWQQFRSGSQPRRAVGMALLIGLLGVGRVTTGAAQEDEGIAVKLAERLTHDDNLYKLPPGIALSDVALGANTRRDDVVNRISLDMDGRWALDRQTWLASVSAAHDRFLNNSLLDNTSGSGAVDWHWQMGHRWSGEWGSRYDRSLAGFANSRFLQKDLFSLLDYHAITHLDITPHWRLNVRARYAQGTHGNDARRTDDFVSTTGAAGFEYRAPGGDRLLAEYRATESTFKRLSPEMPPSLRNYDESTASLSWRHAPSAKTRLDVTAGYLKHSYPHASVPDFSGAIWDAAASWLLTPKVRLVTRAYRQLKAYLDVESDYFVARGFVLGASWAPRSKLQFTLQASRERQQYIAALGEGALFALRNDRLDIGELNVSFAPNRHLAFNLSARAEKRNSVEPLFDYDNAALNLEATWQFGRERS